jgi:hypothetical protein
MENRRSFFFSSATAILSIGAPASAYAFRWVEPNQQVKDTYRNVCSSSRYHEDIIDNVLRDLAAQGIDIGESDIRSVLSARNCPLCGCSVTARTKSARPSGE